MKNNAMITEKAKLDGEVLAISSAAGSTSMNYDMKYYNRGAVLVDVVAEGSVAHLSTVIIDLMQSSASTVDGTSAAAGSAGIVIGGNTTLIQSSVSGARKMTLTMSSATSNQYFTLNLGTVMRKFQYTTSTALNTATADVSTLSYYGSTIGSTVNAGITGSMDRLKTAINSTVNFGANIEVSTNATATLVLQVADSAAGRSLGFQDSTGVMAAGINHIAGGFNLSADQLSSTLNKRYFGVKVSSCATAANVGVSVIRMGGRFNPPTFSGRLST